MLFGFHPDLALLHEGSRVVHLVKGASVTLGISHWPLQRVCVVKAARAGRSWGAADSSSAKVQWMETHINTRTKACYLDTHTRTHPYPFCPTLPPSHTHLKSFLFQAVIAGFKHYFWMGLPLRLVHCRANSPVANDRSGLSKWSHMSDDINAWYLCKKPDPEWKPLFGVMPFNGFQPTAFEL